jgi:hypothetical protein
MNGIARSILASAALIVLIAACSGAPAGSGVATLDDPSASGTPSASPAASALTPQDAALAYARCMRENGVEMPDPKVTTGANGEIAIEQSAGGAVPKEKMAAADATCRHFMTAAGPNGPREPMSAEDLDKLLQFAKCMREHGIDMPDPNADGGIIIERRDGATGPTGPQDDAEFQAANEACASLLPGKLGKPDLHQEGGPPPIGKGGAGTNGTVPQ